MLRCATSAVMLSTQLVSCCAIACPWQSYKQLVCCCTAARLQLSNTQLVRCCSSARPQQFYQQQLGCFSIACLQQPLSAVWVPQLVLHRPWRECGAMGSGIRARSTGSSPQVRACRGHARHLRSLVSRMVWPMWMVWAQPRACILRRGCGYTMMKWKRSTDCFMLKGK